MKSDLPPISDTIQESVAFTLINKWGICDWRKKAEYPNSKKPIKDEEWRWEFLRRDNRYREIWQTWYSGWGMIAYIDELIKYGLSDFIDPRLSYQSYKKITNGREHIFQKYPAILDENNEIPWRYSEISEQMGDDIISTLNNDTDGFADIRINLSRPIAPQLDSIAFRRQLWKQQEKLLGRVLRHRVSGDHAEYLRVIDAKLVGASNTTIGLHIFNCKSPPSAATRGRQAHTKSKLMWQEF